ncbi:MAG TPA: DsbA family protein [Xanthobacteraceae bacterium]|jgi:protein-disulfide isomerase
MDTSNETAGAPSVTRRRMLMGSAAAVIVLAAAGGGYYFSTRPAVSAPEPPAGTDVPMAELMTPPPLGDESLGSANAPVTIIEYASLTCPHCAHFHETTFPELKKKYIETGKVRFIFREFPLDQLAAAGAMLARCAGKDKYFPMIETLFAQQREWVVQKPLEPMFNIARQAGFTQQSFDACLANQQMLTGLQEGQKRAQQFGVNSTPTFFINGKIVRGAMTPEELDKQLAPYLNG